MKIRKVNLKLTLKKQTIADLNPSDLTLVKGGATFACTDDCTDLSECCFTELCPPSWNGTCESIVPIYCIQP